MRKRNRRRGFFKNPRLLAAIVFVTSLAVIWAEYTVGNVLDSYGAHAAETAAQGVFADVVSELCKNEEFSDAVSVTTDETGRVHYFSTDTVLQNELQARLAAALCEAFEQRDRASFSVPLGTLLGDPLSSGRGPSVTFFTALSCSPTVTLSDSFTDAGINQTYHTVTANAELTVLVTALGKSRETVLSLSVPVSQTTVVGDVPQVYAAF